MRRRAPTINQAITQTSELSKKTLKASKLETTITKQEDSTAPAQSIINSNVDVTHRRSQIKDIPFYSDPTNRPPPKPVEIPTQEGSHSSHNNPEINIDLEENSPFQEGVISEIYQRPNKLFFQEPRE